MTVDPRYPIGRYTPPVTLDDRMLGAWRQEIAALPEELEEAVLDLDGTQLDTPYREGGWTVRQVVHHVADSHMNAYVRFKLALTENVPTVKPYEEALWALLPDSSLPIEVSLALIDGLHVRWSTLLDQMTDEQFQRTWFHPEQQAENPLWKATGLYAWHGRHHTAHINTLRNVNGW